MNMNLPKSEPTPQDAEPAETAEINQPKPSATLSGEDVALLQSALGTGLSGFARQGDIVELHKRIGEKFEKLPGELASLDAAKREDLLARVDAIETSLNGLEAAMRIELPPLLTQTVSDAVQSNAPKRSSGLSRLFWVLILACGSAALGAWFHEPLFDLAAQLPAYLSF